MSKLPSNQPASQPQGSRQQSVSVSTQVVAGPLPSPDILVQYNQAVPGAAERIIAMAENDFAHMQSMERMRLSAFYLERRLGQIFAFLIALVALGASVFLAFTGHETTASIIGGATLVSLVSIFVVGRLSRKAAKS